MTFCDVQRAGSTASVASPLHHRHAMGRRPRRAKPRRKLVSRPHQRRDARSGLQGTAAPRRPGHPWRPAAARAAPTWDSANGGASARMRGALKRAWWTGRVYPSGEHPRQLLAPTGNGGDGLVPHRRNERTSARAPPASGGYYTPLRPPGHAAHIHCRVGPQSPKSRATHASQLACPHMRPARHWRRAHAACTRQSHSTRDLDRHAACGLARQLFRHTHRRPAAHADGVAVLVRGSRAAGYLAMRTCWHVVAALVGVAGAGACAGRAGYLRLAAARRSPAALTPAPALLARSGAAAACPPALDLHALARGASEGGHRHQRQRVHLLRPAAAARGLGAHAASHEPPSPGAFRRADSGVWGHSHSTPWRSWLGAAPRCFVAVRRCASRWTTPSRRPPRGCCLATARTPTAR
jgi:hypothetical protein